MCFSMEASVIASSVLFPLGVYSTICAVKKNKSYLMFAMIPILFAIQQLTEGMIWLNIAHPERYQGFSAFYIFFAVFFWPVYIPASVYPIESHPIRKKMMALMLFLGLLGSVTLYTDLIWQGASFQVEVVQHSLSYPVALPYLHQMMYLICYALVIFIPLLLSSNPATYGFGIGVLISLMVSFFVFYYALTSIWCFAAAILSVWIVLSLHRLEKSERGKFYPAEIVE